MLNFIFSEYFSGFFLAKDYSKNINDRAEQNV